eukprot:jgi/Galph1/5610/GphlegSOOS_G4292.1
MRVDTIIRDDHSSTGQSHPSVEQSFLNRDTTEEEGQSVKGADQVKYVTKDDDTVSRGKNTQRRRKRKVYRVVRVSCINCRQSKQACDDFRPCARCIRLGIEEHCVDAPSSRPRPISTEIPTPSEKLFNKMQPSVEKYHNTGLSEVSSARQSYTVAGGDFHNNLLSPFFLNVEQLDDSFLQKFYSRQKYAVSMRPSLLVDRYESESAEDAITQAFHEVTVLVFMWDKDLQVRIRASTTSKELEDVARSHALFCYVLKLLDKYLTLWGVDHFSKRGKEVFAMRSSLNNLESAKPENVARIRSFLPSRRQNLEPEQQHDFLASLPLACLKMSLRVDDSFHRVDFANKEACEFFGTTLEELDILISNRETLPVVMSGGDWIKKPLFLLQLLTESVFKRLQVYHLTTYNGFRYKCQVRCAVLLGENWEPDSYIFFPQNIERIGHDPAAADFLHKTVARVRMEREFTANKSSSSDRLVSLDSSTIADRNTSHNYAGVTGQKCSPSESHANVLHM